MEGVRHEVLIVDDEGDGSFANGAPLLIEALRLVASSRALPLSLSVAFCRAEVFHADDSRCVRRAALEELQKLHETLAFHVECVAGSMSGLRGGRAVDARRSHQKVHFSSLLRCCDGLVMPRDVNLDSFLASQPLFDYSAFRAQFGRLRELVASGTLFSACEPRIKVLQCRYRLYRASNGSREDAFHPTLGGGSFERAPQLDVRRIENCMSANTLVNFMQQTLENEPNILLSTRSPVLSRTTGPNTFSADWGASGCEGGDDEDKEHYSTLKNLVDRFFAASLPLEERYFTPSGLGLVPNYTETIQRSLGGPDSHHATPFQKVHAMPLLRHFRDIFSGSGGELLARLVMPMLSRIVTKDSDRLELEFTITGRLAGEVQHIASWCVRSGLIASKKAQLSLRIVQEPLFASDADCAAVTMEDMLMNIFNPIWLALLRPQEHPELVNFFSQLVSVVVSVSGNADVQELPVVNDPKKYSVGSDMSPPDAFFIYHVWRNVQLLNCMAAAHVFFRMKNSTTTTTTTTTTGNDSSASQYLLPSDSLFLQHNPVITRPILFRLHLLATSKNSFVESVMGLLVADAVVNPLEVFNWSPLAYLYYLTQRSVILIPSQFHNASRDSPLHKAVPFVVETGLNGSIASLDPLYYHTSDNALREEFNRLQKEYQLAIADVTELYLHSAEHANWKAKKRQDILCWPWKRVAAGFNEFTKTQVNSLRLHFRESSLAHEMDLVCRKGLREKSGFMMTSKEWPMHMTALLGQTPQRVGLDDTLWRSPMTLSVAAEREMLWRFFSVPPNGAVKQVDRDVAPRHFVDRQIVYPRIFVLDPTSTIRRDVAQKVARALRRREHYMSFSVHCEPSSLGDLPAARDLQSSPASLPCGEKAHGEQSPLFGQAGLLPRRFTSILEREQRICIPNKFYTRDGVWDVVFPADANDATKRYFRPLPTWNEFQSDVRRLRGVSAERAVQLYAKKRLGLLECKFNLHNALTNDDQDHPVGKASSPRDWCDLYKCIKVDVHCHMAAGITAKELLNFIKHKVQTHPKDVVGVERGTDRSITLGEMFAKLRPSESSNAAVNVAELSVASLRVKAGKDTFNRFDRFNGRYSPLGNSALRLIFLKTNNFMGGRYFAELIHNTFRRQAEDGHIFSEYRLSIYGRVRDEWDRLARWVVLHRMVHSTNRWMVQVPRLYSLYRKDGTVSSFEELLSNIFVPLWEASVHPEQHPFLTYFLSHVSGFDSVDNESELETDVLLDIPPKQWTSAENPPFSYWMYYMWANITALNRYRAARGLSTFTFRPHAGESGDPDHMADVFFLADGVNHGINLKDSPVLQYLFYLAQIPLGITPLSNNALFCKYDANPFPSFFRRGLNVSLATDGALTFHYTEQPLIEEYSTAAHFWNLSPVDICEIAKNSVLMSGFPSKQKKAWLGDLYALRSAAGNDARLSRVPYTRCAFRHELYLEELNYFEEKSGMGVPLQSVMDAQLEDLHAMDVVGLTREEVVGRRLRGQSVFATTAASECCGAHTVAAETDHRIFAPSKL